MENKKRYLTAIISVLMAVSLLVTMLSFTSCKDKSKPEVDDTEEIAETKEADETEDETDKATKESEDTAEATDTAEPSDSSADTTTVPADSSNQNVTTTTAIQQVDPVTSNVGLGSSSEPYLVTPDLSSMTVTTVSIPAGAEVYYDIYRVGGMIVTINDPNAYIINAGYRYDATDGKVIMLAERKMANEAVSFRFGNKSTVAKSFTVYFTNPEGSYANPYVITTLEGPATQLGLQAGDDEVSYYFKYVAEKTGTIKFVMNATEESIMSIQRNKGDAVLGAANTENDGTTEGASKVLTMEANAGDEFMIVFAAKPNIRGKYPATTITWYGTYN